jgi:hypothetical protein
MLENIYENIVFIFFFVFNINIYMNYVFSKDIFLIRIKQTEGTVLTV